MGTTDQLSVVGNRRQRAGHYLFGAVVIALVVCVAFCLVLQEIDEGMTLDALDLNDHVAEAGNVPGAFRKPEILRDGSTFQAEPDFEAIVIRSRLTSEDVDLTGTADKALPMPKFTRYAGPNDFAYLHNGLSLDFLQRRSDNSSHLTAAFPPNKSLVYSRMEVTTKTPSHSRFSYFYRVVVDDQILEIGEQTEMANLKSTLFLKFSNSKGKQTQVPVVLTLDIEKETPDRSVSWRNDSMEAEIEVGWDESRGHCWPYVMIDVNSYSKNAAARVKAEKEIDEGESIYYRREALIIVELGRIYSFDYHLPDSDDLKAYRAQVKEKSENPIAVDDIFLDYETELMIFPGKGEDGHIALSHDYDEVAEIGLDPVEPVFRVFAGAPDEKDDPNDDFDGDEYEEVEVGDDYEESEIQEGLVEFEVDDHDDDSEIIEEEDDCDDDDEEEEPTVIRAGRYLGAQEFELSLLAIPRSILVGIKSGAFKLESHAESRDIIISIVDRSDRRRPLFLLKDILATDWVCVSLRLSKGNTMFDLHKYPKAKWAALIRAGVSTAIGH